MLVKLMVFHGRGTLRVRTSSKAKARVALWGALGLVYWLLGSLALMIGGCITVHECITAGGQTV